MIPKDQRSEANVASSPLSTSGAMYSAVPTNEFLFWASYWIESILSKLDSSTSFFGDSTSVWDTADELHFYIFKSGILDVDVELYNERSDDLVFNTLAVPKSANIMCQFSFRRILQGFKSLWTMFLVLRKLRMLVSYEI